MALTPEERTLIARAVKRDREAFATLYVQYYDAVVARVWPIMRTREEAEDLASEAFLRAWNAIDRFEARDVSILAWLCTIAERLAFKALKRRRPSLNIDDVLVEARREDSPEASAERNAEVATISEAMTKLPNTQFQVLSQRFMDEKSYDDVAAGLGKSAGAVRVIQHRALLALRTILLEKGRREAGPSISAGGIK